MYQKPIIALQIVDIPVLELKTEWKITFRTGGGDVSGRKRRLPFFEDPHMILVGEPFLNDALSHGYQVTTGRIRAISVMKATLLWHLERNTDVSPQSHLEDGLQHILKTFAFKVKVYKNEESWGIVLWFPERLIYSDGSSRMVKRGRPQEVPFSHGLTQLGINQKGIPYIYKPEAE